jgi:cation:H+ antiporter
MSTVLLFLSGLVLLSLGGEAMVRGSSKLASLLGLSPLVIGLTVVAFGTSSPELAVSISSAIKGQPDIVVGNIVGSNIFNILLILGISAIITPLVVAQKLVKIEIPLLILISFAFILFSSNRIIGRIEGIILFSGLVIYIYFVIKESRKESGSIKEEYARQYASGNKKKASWLLNILFIAAGLALLVYGSKLLVDSAVVISRYFGLSELVIGLTVVSAGTSLPEVATSVVASIKGEKDIAVGNAIGSCIFNILAVLGLTSIIFPVRVSEAAFAFDIPVMTVTAVAALPILFSGYRISRWEGGIFFFYYLAYILYLILEASSHDSLTIYNTVMLLFVIPLTVFTLAVIYIRALTRNKNI